MQKKTWESRGLPYASELTLKNFEDLKHILTWNAEQNIGFYRITSNLVPWNSQYDIRDLPAYDEIASVARTCGAIANDNNMRLSFHPPHWCKLASDTPSTATNAARSLEHHGVWLDLLDQPRSPLAPINIHIGATYGDKQATADRFLEQYAGLSDAAQSRLVVENDDKQSLWGVSELVQDISSACGVPITFDYHHHTFTSRGLSYEAGFELAAETWPVRPITHYSEPRRLHEVSTARPQAHAEYIHAIPEWLLEQSDVMVEAGAKELAILALKDD
jgi:UV DNA damage endonuclease